MSRVAGAAGTQQQGASLRLRSSLRALSDTEKKIAYWVLSHAEDISTLSMADIAGECGVSDTSVLRMCRSAGFDGFTDLKIGMIREVVEPTQLILDDISSDDDDYTAVRKVFMEEVQSLYDTLGLLDAQKIERAVGLIQDAGRILVCGVGASNFIAQAGSLMFRRLGFQCVSPADIHSQLIEAALLTKGDLCIAVSFSGFTRDPISVAQSARRQGADVICLTGNAKSQISKYADLVLVSVSHEKKSDPLSSRLSQLAIFDALSTVLGLRNVETSSENEKRIASAIVPKTF